MPGIAWEDDLLWHHTEEMDCESGDLVGGVGSEQVWSSIRSVTLDVPSAGLFRMTVSGGNDIGVQMGACFGCPWEPRYVWLGPGEQVVVELDPGPYYVRMRARSDLSPHVDVQLERLP
jgi:hypothetical protein